MRSVSLSMSLAAVAALAVPATGAAQRAPACSQGNVGLTLSPGFCALIVADSVGRARHLVVAPSGDLFVSMAGSGGGVLALRDADGDGVAEVRERFGPGTGGAGILLKGEWLYFSPNDAVVRYRMPAGSLRPASGPDTIAYGLPAVRSHQAKTMAFGPDGALYVNIGSPSNVCQPSNTKETPGLDPCPELADRAGIWRFDAHKLKQTQADGRRWATGVRNAVAIAQNPADGQVYAAVHGRDNLFQNWGRFYNEDEGADLPSEVFVRVAQGDDYGWPYCYWDQNRRQYVLAPEYGGDKHTAGRCASLRSTPILGFPGHWAPNGVLFYSGSQFPATYRAGVFIAFHGSWNRAPRPQDGYRVVFAPLPGDGGVPKYEIFADGFSGGINAPNTAHHRPVGLAQGPDGSLYITDDVGGRIYRVLFRGTGRR